MLSVVDCFHAPEKIASLESEFWGLKLHSREEGNCSSRLGVSLSPLGCRGYRKGLSGRIRTRPLLSNRHCRWGLSALFQGFRAPWISIVFYPQDTLERALIVIANSTVEDSVYPYVIGRADVIQQLVQIMTKTDIDVSYMILIYSSSMGSKVIFMASHYFFKLFRISIGKSDGTPQLEFATWI